MRFKKILRLFNRGNVCVTGLRGTGKDILFGNVIVRRRAPYVSNINYGSKFHQLDLLKLDVHNKFDNFISGCVNQYQWEYPDGADIYLSDCGVYFPSQYCGQLNQRYEGIITYQALSRQLSRSNVHVNAQNLNRVWDKIREQSDIYIRCRGCIVLFGFVFQGITIYDKYESCVQRVRPCRVRVPLLNPQGRATAETYRDNFFNTHGSVKNRILIYRNRSKHDTYYFRKLLGGKPYEKTNIFQKIKKNVSAFISCFLRVCRFPWELCRVLQSYKK